MLKTIRHDFYFKKLLSSLFPDFIQLFFPDLFHYLDTSSVLPADKEILSTPDTAKSSQADIVMRARFKDADSFFLIHVETQAQHQPEFPRRLFFYFSKLHEKHGLPVYPIVVFSFDSPLKLQDSTYEVRFPDLQVLKFRYRRLQLNQLDWRDYANVHNPVAAALMSRMRISPSDRARVKLKCLTLLKKLNQNAEITRLVSTFIDTYLRLTKRETAEYEMYKSELDPELKEAVMELETSWSIEGRRQGRIEGRVEGRREGRVEGQKEGRREGMQLGIATVVMKLLNLRFGSLTQESTETIHKLDSETLLKLSEAVLSFQSPEDLAKWLAEHTPKTLL